MSAVTTMAIIGLGGNLGRPEQTIADALGRLRASNGVLAVRASRLYRTLPVQASGPDFCNAVARIDTTLTALQLLDLLLAIEKEFGRERSVWHAPRTLDLDLIAMDATRIVSSQLVVPHPRAHERAFVLIPLCEIDTDVLLGPPEAEQLETAGQWAAHLPTAARAEVSLW
jgi:2-amino-4-hydroxy-6-hydroxymethyldihydropteridine diphosphokinase